MDSYTPAQTHSRHSPALLIWFLHFTQQYPMVHLRGVLHG